MYKVFSNLEPGVEFRGVPSSPVKELNVRSTFETIIDLRTEFWLD